MRLFSAAVLTLAGQLLLGAVVYATVAWLLARHRGRRRWRVTWAASARSLRRAAPCVAALALLGGGLAALSPGGVGGALAGTWVHPAWFVVLGAAPAAACHVMWQAGRLEGRGRLGSSRRGVRLGGEMLFSGALAQLALLWEGLFFHPPLRRALLVESPAAGVVLVAAMIALGSAAFAGGAGGLAGKPRPSAFFATLFYVCGVVAAIASHQLTL
jgi:hypothetical protein